MHYCSGLLLDKLWFNMKQVSMIGNATLIITITLLAQILLVSFSESYSHCCYKKIFKRQFMFLIIFGVHIILNTLFFQYCIFQNTVHGGFGTWSNWSECSTTCGQGEHKRIRFCDSPVPDNGGRECLGNSSDYTPCNKAECPGEHLYFLFSTNNVIM